MRQHLLIVGFLTLLLLTNCKKDSQPTPSEELKAEGAWTLSSFSGSSNGTPYSFTPDNLPCLVNNKFTLNSGGTGSQEYTGMDTCFLYKNGNSYATAGVPGMKRAATWTRSGQNISVELVDIGRPMSGTLANVNGKPQLTLNDTLTISYSKFLTMAVYTK